MPNNIQRRLGSGDKAFREVGGAELIWWLLANSGLRLRAYSKIRNAISLFWRDHAWKFCAVARQAFGGRFRTIKSFR